MEAGLAASTPESTQDTQAERLRVLERLLGHPAPQGWQVDSAYDLGTILMATVTRPSDAQPVTVFSVTRASAGFTAAELTAAFGPAPTEGTHPLEVLGYDLVQPRGASTVTVGSAAMPSLDYAWLRVDPDSGSRENGSGSAVWLTCAERDAGNPTFVFASSEMPAGRYDAERLGAFLSAADVCRPPRD